VLGDVFLRRLADEETAAFLLLAGGLVDPLEEVFRQHGVDPHVHL